MTKISGYVGVDFARYTPVVKPEELISGGVSLAIIKADGTFRENASKCADAGLPIMAYHWCDPTEPVLKQVDRTLELTAGLPILGIMGDVEQYWASWSEWYAVYVYKTMAWNLMSKLSPSVVSNNARDVFGEFSKEIYTFGYSSANIIKQYCEPYINSWINNYEWVMAHYRLQPPAGTYVSWEDVNDLWLPDYEPYYPTGLNRENLIGHQFTGDRFAVDGLYQTYYGQGDSRNKYALADINTFDKIWYEKVVDGAPKTGEEIPPPNITDGNLWNGIVVNESGVNIRSGDGTNYPTIGQAIVNGASVIIDDIRYNGSEKWGHVTTVDGESIDAWSAIIWNGKTLISILEDTDTTTEKLYEGVVVSSGNVNFRAGAGSGFPILEDSKPTGTEILADKEIKDSYGNTWLRIISINGRLVDGYMAAVWNGLRLIEYDEIIEEEAPEVKSLSGVDESGNLQAIDISTYSGLSISFTDGELLSLPIQKEISTEPDEPEPEPEPEPHLDWMPDPNRPSELYYTRHGGYAKIPIYESSSGSKIIGEVDFSGIILGDKKENGRLRIANVNITNAHGWVDYTAAEMLAPSRIPEKVLNAPIPPKPEGYEPEIFRYVEATSTNDWQVILKKTKDYNTPQPDTVVLFRDRPTLGQYGWVQVPEKWQWFILHLLMLDAPGQSILYYLSSYAYLVADNRAFTDLKDKDLHTDWILGLNLEKNDPYYWKWSITTRGNILRVERKEGKNVWLDGLDITQDPPNVVDVYNDMSLIDCATQVESNKILSNGIPKSYHFPVIKQEVGGRMEKTRTSIPRFKAPYPVNIDDVGMEQMSVGEKRNIANLERWI